MTFRRDIVETDTAQFGAKKEGKKRTFAGRMQVMESRLNKGWSVVALNDKKTHGKRGAGGAESTSEVLPALRRSLQKETIVAADGSPAFAASKMEKNPFERRVTLDKNFYSHRETLERIFA